ncbi:PLP-dependent cysteine synthase family protein [Rhodovibrionaceae bacterium A322]
MNNRDWVETAITAIEADFNRSADTHLIPCRLPAFPEIDLYLKDESTHPSGSLKHRLARSLFLYGLCNGRITEGTTIIEASSGSTAVSEAYFARLLGLPFVAVMPRSTSHKKIEQIEFQGGRCHLVDDPSALYSESNRLARECSGHFMDQFTYAERATDWRGNNNIAESIYSQMAKERYPIPRWLVTGAGTGGTSATLGRFVRYQRHTTQVCVVDPENSVFYDFYNSGDCDLTRSKGSRIEGIGRPRVEASFQPQVIDQMIAVPDAASLAAVRYLEKTLGRKVGGSTGTNFYGCLQLIREMPEDDRKGAIVTLLCDPGERYLDSYFNDDWLAEQGLDLPPYLTQISTFCDSGKWQDI